MLEEASPYTGWTRGRWERLADQLLEATMTHGSSGHARIRLPGATSAQGRDSDELEGFARTFLLASFRLAGADGRGVDGLADWYRAGLDAGTDPCSGELWPGLDGTPTGQPRVEAASIVIGLHFTRAHIWDRLDARMQQNIIDWLMPSVGARYLDHNWLWFQMIVGAFLRSVGATTEHADREWGLRRNEFLFRQDGWYADGEGNEFDHYNGWAFHFYPLLWTMIEPDWSVAAEFAEVYRDRLRRYLNDAIQLIGADGSPLIQGRSLTYRFAAAAPFWMGAVTGASDLPAGLLRRAASGMASHFVDRGTPENDGLLPIGWHGAWSGVRQDYSGFGSPYWASKGMLGLALPAHHPVWVEPEEPLPSERGDARRIIAAPGWAVSSTREDGIVRVANHGTNLGAGVPEHPMYSRLGYSTATFPPVVGPETVDPLSNAVSVLDGRGRPSHRARLEPRGTAQTAHAVAAYSRHRASWTAASGEDDAGPLVSVVSVLRGAWEIRVITCDSGTARVRVGGWTLAAETTPSKAADGVVDDTGLQSRLILLTGEAEQSGIARDNGVSPLGRCAATPWIIARGDFTLVLAVGLGRTGLDSSPSVETSADEMLVRWPDGQRTQLHRTPTDGVAEWRLRDATETAAVERRHFVPKIALCIEPEMREKVFDDACRRRLEQIGPVIVTTIDEAAAGNDLHDVDVIVTSWGAAAGDGVLRALAPRAQLLVHAAGTVKPVIDEASMRAGLRVSSMATVNATPVVEYTVAMVTLAAKGVLPPGKDEAALMGVPGEQGGFGAVVGILGASRIGRRVIEELRSREVEILVTDPYLSLSEARAMGARRVSLDELFQASQVVSLHAPLLDTTRGMVTRRLLSSLRDGAVLINTARGGLIDEQALLSELRTSRISAILDVTDTEPVPMGHALRRPNVLLTHHIAGSAGNELRRVGNEAVSEIERFVRGRRLMHEVTADELRTMA